MVCQSNLFSELVLSSGTPIKVFRYHFDWKMSKQIKDISFLTMASRAHTKFNFSRTPAMFKEPLKLNYHWKVSVSQRKKRELDNWHLMHVTTLLNTINIFRPTNACKIGKPGVRCHSGYGPPLCRFGPPPLPNFPFKYRLYHIWQLILFTSSLSMFFSITTHHSSIKVKKNSHFFPILPHLL